MPLVHLVALVPVASPKVLALVQLAHWTTATYITEGNVMHQNQIYKYIYTKIRLCLSQKKLLGNSIYIVCSKPNSTIVN